MSNRDRYTQTQLIEAIQAAKGIKSAAAQALGCSRQTVTNYIDLYPAVKAAYQEACEATLDLAESKLIVLVGFFVHFGCMNKKSSAGEQAQLRLAQQDSSCPIPAGVTEKP